MSTPRRISTILAFVIGGAFLIEEPARAVTKTWTGLGADANWTTAANWSPSGAPVAGDDLVFPAGASRLSNLNDTASSTSYNTLSFTGPVGGYNLSGFSIHLPAGLTADNSALNTVSLDITLTASQTFSVSGDRLRLSGIFVGNTLTFSVGSTGIVEVLDTIIGPGGVTVSGSPGHGVFINADATYSGPTNVAGGFLSVAGVALNPASVVTVSGGVLQFLNGGSAGPVTANTGQVFLGGGAISEIGNVTDLTMQAASSFFPNMMGPAMFATLNASGAVTLNNPTLIIFWFFTSNSGDSFTILNKTSAGAITGTFSGLPEGSTFLSNGRTYQITYVGGDGNDVVLTDVTGGATTPTPTVTPVGVSTATPTRTPTLAGAPAVVPTLGAGGLAALVGLLVLSALFVLRRSSL
jgi:hypothetical protein